MPSGSRFPLHVVANPSPQGGRTVPCRRGLSRGLRVLWPLVLYSLAVQSEAAAQRPSQRFGIVTFEWDGTVAAKLSELGVGVIRGSCKWEDMQPSRETFTWGCSDNVILGAAAQGLQVLMTVECTPSWARSGGGCNTMPASMSDWYNFVAAFVQRYAAYDVVLGVWNEPNLPSGIDGSPRLTSSNYCALFTNASDARNAFIPGFRLGGPETSDGAIGSSRYSRNGRYFSNVMDCINGAGALAAQDVTTVHWYEGGPPILDYMDAARSQSGGTHDVWLSEAGKNWCDPSTQASFYASRMMDMENITLTRPWWTKIIFYRLWDGSASCNTGGVDSLSILSADFVNTPAFVAYRDWIADEAGTSTATITANQVLYPNQCVDSANDTSHLCYQADGNLVLYDPNWGWLWQSETAGSSPGFAILQTDGNLVVYDASHRPVWWSGTEGHPDAYVVVQNSGDLFVFDATGVPLRRIH